MYHKVKFIFVFSALTLLSACAVFSPTYVDENSAKNDSASTTDLNTVYFKQSPHFISSPPSCIAVLPLTVNNTQKLQITQKDGSKKNALTVTPENLHQLRWILYSHLAPYSYRDIELNQIDSVVKSTNYTPKKLKKIGKQLNCEASLVGQVTEYYTSHLGFYSQSAIGMELKLFRASDSKVLWQARHVAESHAGAAPITPIALAVGLYSASENVSDQHLVHVADDLCRRLFSTWETPQKQSPTMQLAKKKEFPYYVSVHKLFLRSGPGQKFKPVDTLNFQERFAMLNDKKSPWLQVKMADGQRGYVHKNFIAQAQ